jgi:hypothetical protein
MILDRRRNWRVQIMGSEYYLEEKLKIPLRRGLHFFLNSTRFDSGLELKVSNSIFGLDKVNVWAKMIFSPDVRTPLSPKAFTSSKPPTVHKRAILLTGSS